MKKFILTISFAATLIFGTMNAQQLGMFSQYMSNDFVLNPAFAGSETAFSPLRLVVRNQWAGIEGSPQTQTLSFHTALMEGKMGIGAYVFNDRFGTVGRTGINATYSYSVKVGDNDRLGFGLSAVFYRYHLSTDSLIFDGMHNMDPIIYNRSGDFKTYAPNANFGISYTGKKFWIGVGVPDLIPMKIATTDSFYIVKELPHIYGSLGYKILLSEGIYLEPSLMIKSVSGAPIQIDFNANLKIKDKVNIAGTYRAGDAVSVMAGFKIKEQYTLGLAYDFIISGLNSYAGGNYEVMLGINILKGGKKEEGGDAPKDDAPKEEQPEKKDDSKEQK